MRLSRLLIGTVVAAVIGAGATLGAALPANAVTADGTLALTTANPVVGGSVTFHFSTDAGQVTDKNWVALYDDPTDGPVNQTFVGGSTSYQYVTTASGDVTFDTTGMTPGTKVAYFLYDDGYQWLATPVAFTLLPTGAPTTDGTLALTNTAPAVGDQLTLTYSTQAGEVDPTNWVAIYNDPTDGPIDQTFVGGSTSYQYVTTASGQVTFDSSGLTPGAKVAYFLAKDGYTWLADPVSFFIAPGSGGPTDDGTLTLTSTDLTVGAPLTFHYTTDTPDAPANLNWVGLYDNPADGPTDQTYHAGSTVWSYVSGTSGDVTLDSIGDERRHAHGVLPLRRRLHLAGQTGDLHAGRCAAAHPGPLRLRRLLRRLRAHQGRGHGSRSPGLWEDPTGHDRRRTARRAAPAGYTCPRPVSSPAPHRPRAPTHPALITVSGDRRRRADGLGDGRVHGLCDGERRRRSRPRPGTSGTPAATSTALRRRSSARS